MAIPADFNLPYQPSPIGERVHQGEILCNISQVELDSSDLAQSETEARVSIRVHPVAVVISQECDLQQDWHSRVSIDDKLSSALPNILLCEMVEAAALRGSGLNSRQWTTVRLNKNERYHFLERVPPGGDAVGEGLPEMGIDFKRYFTVPSDSIYYQIRTGDASRRCRLISPYLEHLSTRFAYYQFRVGLPRDHFSES